MHLIHSIKHRWHTNGGYREFLVLALPLILTSASWSIQHFVDRVFLAWHSNIALAASLPSGMTNFIILSLFLGTAQYLNSFVAQYVGAQLPKRVGPVIWTGIYLAFIATLIALIPAYHSEALFDLIGHPIKIRNAEATYFRILCYGVGPQILSTAASCFFTGRGKTMTVLTVNIVVIIANSALDYALIFGNWGFKEMGIAGAAWATNISAVLSALIFLSLFFQKTNRIRFDTLSGWKPELNLIKRLFRYGGPNGITFMLDITAFSIFVIFVGRLGEIPLAATTLAFNINTLAFMPLIGCGTAVATMVGHRLGYNDESAAEYCTWTGVHIAVGYMSLMTAGYLIFPELFLYPFGAQAQGYNFEAANIVAKILLRIVAIYCIFDAFYMVFSYALKGAGDTKYVMLLSITINWGVLVLPTYLALTFFNPSIYLLWSFLCMDLILLSALFYRRFQTNKWKNMRVIESF